MDKEEKELRAERAKFREQNEETKTKAGRYQLGDAARFIADKSNENVDSMMQMLFKEARDSRLTVYEPGTNVPYQFSTSQNLDNEVWLEAYWNDLNEWLKNNLPRLDCEFPKPDASAAKGKPVPTTTPAQVSRNKLRRNSLDPAIDKAIKQAGNMELAAVYLELKELALSGEKPFTGVFDVDALCYTDDNNEPAKLNKGALGKRLKNRR